MKILIDGDVAQVAEFMMQNIRARELRRVAHALVQVADLMWTDCIQPEQIHSFRLERDGNRAASRPLVASPLQPDANELP